MSPGKSERLRLLNNLKKCFISPPVRREMKAKGNRYILHKQLRITEKDIG